MNKTEWIAKAESELDSRFLEKILNNVEENLGKLIYEAKKQCLEREPKEVDEKRFYIKEVAEDGLPKAAFYFDETLAGYIQQKEFHGLDLVGNNYTIALEYNSVR